MNHMYTHNSHPLDIHDHTSRLRAENRARGWISRVGFSLLAGVIALLATDALNATAGQGTARLLLRPKRNVSERALQSVCASQGLRQIDAIRQIGVRVLVVSEERLPVVLAALKRNPGIEFVEVDEPIAPECTVDDQYYTNQWHLPMISAPEAWDTCAGSSQVVIAILDTGVDVKHPDLIPKLVPGWNMYDNNSNANDVQGHGTRCAGLAAACGNNRIGVASPAFNCRLMPIRVTDAYGNAYTSLMAKGLIWAADNGARIANLSFRVSHLTTVWAGADYFRSKGGLVFVAAGNDHQDLAARDVPSIITVSGTDSTDRLASFSNYGAMIDISAPASGMYTTKRGSKYNAESGTSFAAPTAASVAALIMSVNPALTPDQVEAILKQSADDRGAAGWDPSFGWGRVNAARAVRMAKGTLTPGATLLPEDVIAPRVAISSPKAGAKVTASTPIFVSASSVVSVQFFVDGVLCATSSTAPFVMTWDATSAKSGTHTLVCRGFDASGQAATSLEVKVSR